VRWFCFSSRSLEAGFVFFGAGPEHAVFTKTQRKTAARKLAPFHDSHATIPQA
jgi:hypothetical protein